MDQWLEQYRGILLVVLIAVVIIGIVLFQTLRPQPKSINLTDPTSVPSPEITHTPCPQRVYVSGAVHNPDVYALSPDSIVKDAIVAAGGATEDADLDRINLALRVADEQHVYVPHIGEDDLPVQPPSIQQASEDKVNINKASCSELESLPGIGPTIAQRIVDYRQSHGPFSRIEDITNVAGIGPATLEKIRELITTE
jgi:competence protein ComEA